MNRPPGRRRDPGQPARDPARHRRPAGRAGFSFVFVTLATLRALGEWLWTYSRQTTMVLGGVTVLVGLVPWLKRG